MQFHADDAARSQERQVSCQKTQTPPLFPTTTLHVLIEFSFNDIILIKGHEFLRPHSGLWGIALSQHADCVSYLICINLPVFLDFDLFDLYSYVSARIGYSSFAALQNKACCLFDSWVHLGPNLTPRTQGPRLKGKTGPRSRWFPPEIMWCVWGLKFASLVLNCSCRANVAKKQ